MKRAIISDIHGNYPAARAVFDDIESQGIKTIYCLGDTVGYGAKPSECLELVRNRCAVVLCGNHDYAVIEPAMALTFNMVAYDAVQWTARVLDAKWTDYIEPLQASHDEGEILFCHASPRDHLNEYVFPAHIDDALEMRAIFTRIRKLAFVGHTHVPGIFVEWGNDFTFTPQSDLNGPFDLLQNQKMLINVGSVGQPRDRNPEACYVVLDDTSVTFRRVPYPIEEAAESIRDVPELDNFLAERILEGR